MTDATNNSLGNLVKALAGELGDDQKRIAETGIAWLDMLLRKNQDYGSSAWKPPRLAPKLAAGDAILVRLSDKLERLSTLLANQGAAKVDESIEDTMRDAGGYFLLYLARPTGAA